MSSQTTSSAVIPSVLADDASSCGSDTPLNRSDPDRWYFPKERLESTPSRRNGIDPDKELTYRQQSANFIQDIGQRLQVNQLCINTAIVYMHRFYMFHSFTHFHRNAISAASIFLAAKVEEQPRKLEHVIKVAHYCLHRDHQPQVDPKSEQYLEQSAELVMNENILLQTLGFDVAIDHPHTHVVKCCQLVRASKDLAQTSYFMATNSLHLTTMSLQYKPTVVACVCIHLACKWSSWEIPRSKEGKDWFWYVDDSVTSELLEKLTTDFLQIFNKSPSRLKRKIMSLNNAATSSALSLTNMPYHGLDSSPGQHAGRSRSPSPKRPPNQKPSNSQPVVPGKPKPHGMPMPHHPGMKMPYAPGQPGSGANKHLSSHPPHGHPSSSKPPHPGVPPGSIKDPHHPHHPPPHGKHPYPPHGQGQHAHGQYPHGSRPGMPPSGSSQSHHGHGVHSKPPTSGSSSSHPYSSSSSSSAMKNMQPHNPSKPPHMPPSGAPKMPPNQVPGAVKNPSQPMFHSSQSHMKKPYEARPEFGLSKREGPPSGNVHHSQNHARTHDKLLDGRHHSSASGMQPSHNSSSQSSGGDAHHSMPYMGQEMERNSSSSSSNQKMPYMDSRSSMSGSEMSRHRMPPSSDPSKRGLPHGAAAATNGNNTDSLSSLGSAGGSGSGAGDSHVPSKTAYRATQPQNSTFGQSSQMEMGANKYHAPDNFGGEFGSVFGSGSSSSTSSVMSIEDRRKRRMAEGMSTGGNQSKRPRSDAYVPSVPISTNSLFSPEELAESSSSSTTSSTSSSNKRLPPPTSQFSPSALDGTQSNYSSKGTDRSQIGTGNSFGGTSSSDGLLFGSSNDNKPDIRSSSRLNPSVEFQPPSLLQPISDSKSESLLSGGSVGNNVGIVCPPPRVASLFSPEFTPSTNTNPPKVNIAPPPPPPTTTTTAADIHMKRELLFSNLKQEAASESVSQKERVSTNSYSDGSGGGSQSGLTGRLSGSPKRESGDDSHSKKSKKSKKEKHKHKHKEHKEEKKHKKDKHKDKEKEKDKDKEKDKKDKHRSKDKHSSSSSSAPPPPVEVTNDVVPSHKIKIKLPRGDDTSSKSSSSTQSSSAPRHSSSKISNSSSSSSANPSLPGLKVKISNKGRVSSVDDDAKHGLIGLGGSSPGDVDTPCCPGFGPCLTCNRDQPQDHYRFFSTAPAQGLTMKFAKSKESSKSSSSKESSSSSSKDSKKSKEKSSKSSSSSSSASSAAYNNSMPVVMSSGSSRLSLSSSHHIHKNGMEKSSKKKDKSAV